MFVSRYLSSHWFRFTAVACAGLRLPVSPSPSSARRAYQQERPKTEREVARGERSERDRAERKPTEREVAQQQLEAMRIAIHALREGEKRDAVGLMERAIHARELQLAGRRDDEARQIMERAPNRANWPNCWGSHPGLCGANTARPRRRKLSHS